MITLKRKDLSDFRPSFSVSSRLPVTGNRHPHSAGELSRDKLLRACVSNRHELIRDKTSLTFKFNKRAELFIIPHPTSEKNKASPLCPPLPSLTFAHCYCSLLPSKNGWQSRKDIVNLTADVVRIKASAEQFEDQGPACLRAWRKLLPAISCTLSLIRSLSHSENAG